MSSTTRVGFVAGASMLAVSTVSLAGTGMDAQDYEARIMELERQVAQLRGDDRAEARTEEIRAIVNEALADADTRSSLLQSGMVAGWDDGFMLGSQDGAFTLRISGQLQTRFVANLREDSGDDDTEYGFETRRAKLSFSGNVVDSSWKYNVRGAFDRTSGEFELEQASIDKVMDSMTIRFGQFKPLYLREETILSSKQQAVERSLANERYTQDYVQGIQVSWEQDNFKLAGAVHDGFGSRNTSAVDQQSEFAFNARADVLLAGNWSQFDDYAGFRGQEYGARVGGGFFWEKDAYGSSAVSNEAEQYGFTVDGQVEGDGWSAAAAFIWRTTDTDASGDPDEMALVVQGGYFVTDNDELFARWTYADDDGGDDFEEINVITAGWNHYLSGHDAKLSFDVVYALDSIGTDFATSGAGIQADAADEDGQLALRGQFQLLF